MKQIIEYITNIKLEVPPFTIPALAAIAFIFIFVEEKMPLLRFIRISIMCLFFSAISYFLAEKFGFPYPSIAAVAGAIFGSPIGIGLLKLSYEFKDNPTKVIKRLRK